MSNPSRLALRWGAPVALAATAIAAQFVVPVFGGNGAVTQKSLKNQVQAKEKRIGAVGVGVREATMGTMSLAPGNYVFTSNYQVVRKDPKVYVSCRLHIAGVDDFGPNTATSGPDVPASNAVPTIDSGALTGGSRVEKPTAVRLKCQTNHGNAILADTAIIALKVPKLTVHKDVSPG
jgi:hypothetical protein